MPRTFLGSARYIINNTPIPPMSDRISTLPSGIDADKTFGIFAVSSSPTSPPIESIEITDTENREGYEINNITTLNGLTFPNLTALTAFAALKIQSNTALGDFICPLLASAAAHIIISGNDSLGTISFPALTTAYLFNFADNPLLTDVDVSALTALAHGFNASGCALSEATVDAILAQLVSIPTWGDASELVDLSGGTSSPPSVAGAADAATLSLRGASVNTN